MPTHEFEPEHETDRVPRPRPAPAHLGAHALLDLQRAAGNAAVADAIRVQRVDTDAEASDSAEEEAEQEAPPAAAPEMSIGERKYWDRELQKRHSDRLLPRHAREYGPIRPQPGAAGRRPAPYRQPAERGIWNGATRPAYFPATWTAILGGLPSKVDGKKTTYRCPTCEEYVPKWSMRRSRENGITIDHHVNYKRWITENAAARDEDGKITNTAAQAAYNDLTNLVAMCRDCNSSKNGEKGVLD